MLLTITFVMTIMLVVAVGSAFFLGYYLVQISHLSNDKAAYDEHEITLLTEDRERHLKKIGQLERELDDAHKGLELALEKGDDWTPGRWWRLLSSTGSIWMETSDHTEVTAEALANPGFTLQKEWATLPRSQWRDVKIEDICHYCDHPIHKDARGVWVDETEGDSCSAIRREHMPKSELIPELQEETQTTKE